MPGRFLMERVHFNDLPTDVQERIINEAVGDDIELANLYADALRENNELLDVVNDADVMDTDGDGTNDLALADVDGNGEPDVAAVSADSAAEEKEALKTAKEELNIDGDDKTTTGKSKKELDKKPSDGDEKHPIGCDCLECNKKRAQLFSNNRQKNVLSALLDMRF